MADQVSISIIKANDNDYFQALRTLSKTSVAKELKLAQLTAIDIIGSEFKVSFNDSATDDEASNEDLEGIMSNKGKAIRRFDLKGPHVAVTITRTDNFETGELKRPEDQLTITYGNDAEGRACTGDCEFVRGNATRRKVVQH